MSQLVVRNIEPPLVLALKQRAAKHGHSAEEEHRRILEEALRAPRKRSFLGFLASMPEVGLDEDFERHRPPGGVLARPVEVGEPTQPRAAFAKAASAQIASTKAAAGASSVKASSTKVARTRRAG